MRILVYGGFGWIGNLMIEILKSRGHEVIIGRSRVNNYSCLSKEIRTINPDRVFSSTGRTHGVVQNSDGTKKEYTTIDYLELPQKLAENIQDNLRGPINLAMICKELKIHLTYMGTGCIFSYDEEHKMPNKDDMSDLVKGFMEEDHPNFFGSGYSTVKGQTDRLMHNYDDSVLNCRIRMPITNKNNRRNFITKITTYEKICSIPNSMTVLNNILPIMAHMLETGETGTYNMTNPGYITHNAILDMYKDIVDKKFTYINFTLDEQAKILLSGRSNNYLNTDKLEYYCEKHNLDLMNIKDAVKNSLNNWQN
tara:strand:- start:5067 stop:5993 length:927 start_codon:yes stop_codon:yes gene_type:complete